MTIGKRLILQLVRGSDMSGSEELTERLCPRFREDRPRGQSRHAARARDLASDNPVIYRDRIVGDYVLSRTSPGRMGL